MASLADPDCNIVSPFQLSQNPSVSTTPYCLPSFISCESRPSSDLSYCRGKGPDSSWALSYSSNFLITAILRLAVTPRAIFVVLTVVAWLACTIFQNLRRSFSTSVSRTDHLENILDYLVPDLLNDYRSVLATQVRAAYAPRSNEVVHILCTVV